MCYRLLLEEPKVLDLMKFFKVDYSLNLSSKVIDNVTTTSIPDVRIDYVKKARRIAPEEIEKIYKEYEAFTVIPILEFE